MREALIGQNSCTGMHTGLETEWFITTLSPYQNQERKNNERRTTMYKILIKHNPNANKSDTTIWRMHGSTTTSTTSTSFKEFETDNIETLKAELLALDLVYGHENIRPIKDIETNYVVDVVDSDAATGDTTENNQSTDITTDENKNNGK